MYIIFEKVSENKGIVNEVILLPSAADKERAGVDIGDKQMIYPKNIPGKAARLMVNLEDKELYFDYYTPETTETKVLDLQRENTDISKTLGNLIIESATDKATISSLEDTIGSLLLEIASMKGGVA